MLGGNEAAKSCDFDPIPSCVDVPLPSLVSINCEPADTGISRATGTFPTDVKSTLLKPLIEKPNVDTGNMKNYIPVSDLACLDKLAGNVVVRITMYKMLWGTATWLRAGSRHILYRRFHGHQQSRCTLAPE